MLGGFSLVYGKKPLPNNYSGTSKMMQLFQILLYAGREGIPRAELIERLYGREELEAIAADMVNPTEVRVLKGTSPADLIVNCAKEEGCDLIIMGSRGQGGVKGFLGSVSYAVTKESPMTVLIAKEGDCR